MLSIKKGFPGATYSAVLRRGLVLELKDVSGGSNISALFYNAHDKIERYNMPDTLKAQYAAFLTKGRVLYSDMGRVLCSIIEDSCGWHDTISGVIRAKQVEEKFGSKNYQDFRNNWHKNGFDNFIVELGKHGLGKKDFAANVNFFSKVQTNDDGDISLLEDHSKAGNSVKLRMDMDVLVVLSNTPHPLAKAGDYATGDVELNISQGSHAAADDICRMSRPENQRGFENTENYVALTQGIQG